MKQSLIVAFAKNPENNLSTHFAVLGNLQIIFHLSSTEYITSLEVMGASIT
jgi:hypothetical protein